ncbi:MAG: DNA polymerase III subunit chi [Paracoccaceae bacterium]
MGEVLFYHLSETPLERTLPGLIEKSLHRGWRVYVRGGHRERLAMLDDFLWTYRDDSFLPHGMADPARQPVFLSDAAGNPNAANVLMLIDGLALDSRDTEEFERVCVLFDGNDADATQSARSDWLRVSKAGGEAIYWAQENGRWVRKS